jgi:hypothetical protein
LADLYFGLLVWFSFGFEGEVLCTVSVDALVIVSAQAKAARILDEEIIMKEF